MIRKFASINNPEKYAFAYDSEAWTSKAPIDVHFRMYETYGDGACQHSGDWAITTEHFADYLISLTAAMLADSELADALSYRLSSGVSREEIEFCASIVFKAREEGAMYEKKTRYYSVAERKTSSTPTKQYDTRYKRIEPWNDGTAEAIYRMLIPEWADGLTMFAMARSIREWALKAEGQYMQLVGLFLKWTETSDEAREMYHSFDAAREVAESYRLRASAESQVENCRRNVERKRAAVESVEVAA
jgi:hypothetical protein